MIFIIVGCLLLIVVGLLPIYLRYKGSNYKNASGNTFTRTILSTGNYGEFLTFSYLEQLGSEHKLLTNLYIPKEDGLTTEIDLIMISETGIYVFESKNYSGWIFGSEKNKKWTQVLQNKQKNHFFNPIWQNNGHINALKHTLDIEKDNLYKSYIVFSKRCTLKKISIISKNVKVIKRNVLKRTLKKDIKNSDEILTAEEVNSLYLNLQKYTNVDIITKKLHIDNMKLKLNK